MLPPGSLHWLPKYKSPIFSGIRNTLCSYHGTSLTMLQLPVYLTQVHRYTLSLSRPANVFFLSRFIVNHYYSNLYRVAQVNIFWIVWFNLIDLNIILVEVQVLCLMSLILLPLIRLQEGNWTTWFLKFSPSCIIYQSAWLWLCPH